MLKKIMSVGLILVFVFSLSGCERDWSKDFNLLEMKVIWDETTFEESLYEYVHSIGIIFKSTTTFPKLKLKDLKLKNIKEFKYVSLGPFNDSGESGNQVAIVILKKMGKEKIIEAVRHLEKLPFTLSIEPMYGVLVPD